MIKSSLTATDLKIIKHAIQKRIDQLGIDIHPSDMIKDVKVEIFMLGEAYLKIDRIQKS